MEDRWMETNLQTVKSTYNAETSEYYAYANAVYVRVDRLRLLEKWWEEAEDLLISFRHGMMLERNAALEEAAQIFDKLVESSSWNPDDLEYFAVKIRSLKE